MAAAGAAERSADAVRSSGFSARVPEPWRIGVPAGVRRRVVLQRPPARMQRDCRGACRAFSGPASKFAGCCRGRWRKLRATSAEHGHRRRRVRTSRASHFLPPASSTGIPAVLEGAGRRVPAPRVTLKAPEGESATSQSAEILPGFGDFHCLGRSNRPSRPDRGDTAATNATQRIFHPSTGRTRARCRPKRPPRRGRSIGRPTTEEARYEQELGGESSAIQRLNALAQRQRGSEQGGRGNQRDQRAGLTKRVPSVPSKSAPAPR
jgi:hypothetical protein